MDRDDRMLADFLEAYGRGALDAPKNGRTSKARELLRRSRDEILAQRAEIVKLKSELAELRETVAKLRAAPLDEHGGVPLGVVLEANAKAMRLLRAHYGDDDDAIVVADDATLPIMSRSMARRYQQHSVAHARDVRSDRSKKKKPNKTKVDDYRKPGGEYLLPDSYEYDDD